jgi:hypothetical protein
VEALAARYPRALLRLSAEWFTEAALAERLGAMVVWRRAVDEGLVALDPRAELDFQDALDRLREILDERHRAALTGQRDHPHAPGDADAAAEAAVGRLRTLQAALEALPEEELPDLAPEDAFFRPESAQLPTRRPPPPLEEP